MGGGVSLSFTKKQQRPNSDLKAQNEGLALDRQSL